jgi:hypothetical protein
LLPGHLLSGISNHEYNRLFPSPQPCGALLVSGLQLSLVLFPLASLRAGENEERNGFNWENLQSDIAGVADRTDANLVNSWGLTINTTANVFWISDNNAGVSTLYRPDGSPVLLGNSG